MRRNKHVARKIIMDVDTGTDDATAIISAVLAEELDLVAVCTVGGARDLDTTTKHTLMVLELLGSSVPVYKGCPGPIVKDLYKHPRNNFVRIAKDEDGNEFGYHDDFQLPAPKKTAETKHAVSFLIEALSNAEEKTTLVATGPLTNVAMALRIRPDLAQNIEELVCMSGGINETNITSGGEGNAVADPEAMAIVLESGVKLTVITLDATHRAALPKEYIDKCKKLHSSVGDFFAEMLFQRVRVYNALQPLKEKDVAPIHDALCIAYLIDPSVIDDIRLVPLAISLDHNVAAGAFIIDTRFYHDPVNASVAYSADPKRFGDIVMCLLEKTASHQ